MSHIFISYKSEDGDFADLLKSKIKDAGFSIWMDTDRLNAGQDWRARIDQGIKEAFALIVVMTPGAKASEYVTYEWAFALGTGVHVIAVMFKPTELHPRLEALQYLDFTKREARRWDLLIKVLQELQQPSQSYSTQLEESIGSVAIAGGRLEDNPYFRNNICFQHIVTQSLSEMSNQLASVGSGPKYFVPATQYPHYLISIQRELKARVKAVALVDQEEYFWQQKAGREIMYTAHKESARVFVFTNPTKFEQNFETLVKYASAYHVYAMSFEMLSREFETYARDFSIIEVSGDKVLAEYDDTTPLKTIRFSADPVEITTYEEVLDRIIRSAVQIPMHWSKDPDQLREQVFASSKLSPFRFQPIEMSGYIIIDDYDEHEEKHAYYQEMMRRMIDIFSEHRSTDTDIRRVLELGAGTGIFTRRLAALPELECVAVEIDWVCFNKLKHNLAHYHPKVLIYNKDSRTYNPNGQFDYIFSSFADHHIKNEDKTMYFENIKRNLSPGGKLIVGDEFLPPYDPNSRDAWRAALETYHNHIIELAQRQASEELAKLDNETSHLSKEQIEELARSYLELVKLERDALHSGLEQKGDFKISCEQYEAHLRSSGFEFSKEKIGPKDRDDVGGVYVYVAWLPDWQELRSA